MSNAVSMCIVCKRRTAEHVIVVVPDAATPTGARLSGIGYKATMCRTHLLPAMRQCEVVVEAEPAGPQAAQPDPPKHEAKQHRQDKPTAISAARPTNG